MLEPLSAETITRVDALFAVPQRAEVANLLLRHCGSDLPGLADHAADTIERVRFGVLKLSDGDHDKLREAIELANTDWRDVLIWAGFGSDIVAHKAWNPTAV